MDSFLNAPLYQKLNFHTWLRCQKWFWTWKIYSFPWQFESGQITPLKCKLNNQPSDLDIKNHSIKIFIKKFACCWKRQACFPSHLLEGNLKIYLKTSIWRTIPWASNNNHWQTNHTNYYLCISTKSKNMP